MDQFDGRFHMGIVYDATTYKVATNSSNPSRLDVWAQLSAQLSVVTPPGVRWNIGSWGQVVVDDYEFSFLGFDFTDVYRFQENSTSFGGVFRHGNYGNSGVFYPLNTVFISGQNSQNVSEIVISSSYTRQIIGDDASGGDLALIRPDKSGSGNGYVSISLFDFNPSVFTETAVFQKIAALRNGDESFLKDFFQSQAISYLGSETLNDYFDGGVANDSLRGNAGNDTINGGLGADGIDGGIGNDSLTGDFGLLPGVSGVGQGDVINGGDGNDTLSGGGGNDQLYGDAGNDLMFGGDDDDYFVDTGVADGVDTIHGGSGNDTLTFAFLAGPVTIDTRTSANNFLGNAAWTSIETIIGTNGSDFIFLSDEDGIGNRIISGNGDDQIGGGDGNDTLEGGDGIDFLYGWIGNDSLVGGNGNDTLYGEQANDSLIGGNGNDELVGHEGDDELFGEAGDDRMFGGDGLDRIRPGSGNDTVNGGAGTRDAIFLDGKSVGYWDVDVSAGSIDYYGDEGLFNEFKTISGIERFFFGSPTTVTVVFAGSRFGADYLEAGNAGDLVFVEFGNDTLFSGAGVDDLTLSNSFSEATRSSLGDDVINLATGIVTRQYSSFQLNSFGLTTNTMTVGGFEIVYAGDGKDFIQGAAADEELHGQVGNDTVWGGAGLDSLFGDNGNDELFGETGSDSLYGGDGVDSLYGWIGDDYMLGEGGDDLAFGEDGDDFIGGMLGSDTLWGGNGRDVIFGDQGDDSLFGEAGFDEIHGGDGADVAYGWTGNDVMFGFVGNDVLHGEQENDFLYGWFGNDVLWGGTGRDELYGEQDNDTLIGGLGRDTMNGGTGADAFYTAFSEMAAQDVDLITAYDSADRYFFQSGAQIQYFSFSAPNYVGAGIHVQVSGGVYILDVLGATTTQLQAQTLFF
jgi:Ca2+-binding RTX toxin-like protein